MTRYAYVIRRRSDGKFLCNAMSDWSSNLSKAFLWNTKASVMCFVQEGEDWQKITITERRALCRRDNGSHKNTRSNKGR